MRRSYTTIVFNSRPTINMQFNYKHPKHLHIIPIDFFYYSCTNKKNAC